jgi:murein DD-endopeptidase MepM/ murein hydrolase activator NlpD
MEIEIALMKEQNDQIFRQLEEAMSVSVAPLDKMFRAAGMPTDRIIEQVRRGYSGQGGPLTPLSFSTSGEEPSPDTLRANLLLNQMDQLNLYRIAAQKAPFATPVKSSFRFTSSFGFRRDPKTGGRRMHNGVDFAASLGTPLYATADGVVTHSGWLSGYGRLVKIQHDFGIETRYAHLSRLNVKVGQRVSRGQRIGDMGASGRVTGVHLHYEVRVGGKAVNPMIYIKAANDVF